MSGVVDTVSEAIDGLAGVDLDTLTDGELDDELVAMVRLRHRLDAEIARRADRWDRRTIWRGDGSKAPWARLSRTTGVAPGTARGILRRGHAITAMPATAEAWAAGEVGADHVDLLADAASNGRGDLFRRDETVLVDHCRELTWGQAVKAVRYWTFRADAELNRDGTPPPASSSAHLDRLRRHRHRRLHPRPDRRRHLQRSAPTDRTRPVPRRPTRRHRAHHARADGRRVGRDGHPLPDGAEEGQAARAVGVHPRRRSDHRTPLRTVHRCSSSRRT